MTLNKHTKIIYFYEIQNKQCYYCKCELYINPSPTNFELVDCNIDHKLPTSRGGKDTIDNQCLSCVACNSAKANMTEEEFGRAIEKLNQGIITRKDLAEYAKYLILKNRFRD